jgi:hypothetical protein
MASPDTPKPATAGAVNRLQTDRLGSAIPRFTITPTPNAQVQYCLHYGSNRRPLATVVPDAQWPGMFRIAWPDGQLSDMANLSRTKDAAMAIAERGPPRRDARHLHWKIDARERPAEAPPGDWQDWPAEVSS